MMMVLAIVFLMSFLKLAEGLKIRKGIHCYPTLKKLDQNMIMLKVIKNMKSMKTILKSIQNVSNKFNLWLILSKSLTSKKGSSNPSDIRMIIQKIKLQLLTFPLKITLNQLRALKSLKMKVQKSMLQSNHQE